MHFCDKERSLEKQKGRTPLSGSGGCLVPLWVSWRSGPGCPLCGALLPPGGKGVSCRFVWQFFPQREKLSLALAGLLEMLSALGFKETLL